MIALQTLKTWRLPREGFCTCLQGENRHRYGCEKPASSGRPTFIGLMYNPGLFKKKCRIPEGIRHKLDTQSGIPPPVLSGSGLKGLFLSRFGGTPCSYHLISKLLFYSGFSPWETGFPKISLILIAISLTLNGFWIKPLHPFSMMAVTSSLML
jgi:hypothetical protein